MRIIVFGANGKTGRLLSQQALDAGHDVVAVTRNPQHFPLADKNLSVVGADATDPSAVLTAVSGSDVVLSALGVPFSRRPVSVYSRGIAAIITAMRRSDVHRIVAVTSSAVEPRHHADGGFWMNRVIQPLVVRTIGRTTYDDMRVLEHRLRESDLNWTIVRPSGLFDTPSPTRYVACEDHADGIFTARTDLAAFMLAQVDNTDWVRKVVAVTTEEGMPSSVWAMLRQEAFR